MICGEKRPEKQGSQEKWHFGIVAVRFKDSGKKEVQIGSFCQFRARISSDRRQGNGSHFPTQKL